MRIPLELFLLGFRKNAAAFGSQNGMLIECSIKYEYEEVYIAVVALLLFCRM